MKHSMKVVGALAALALGGVARADCPVQPPADCADNNGTMDGGFCYAIMINCGGIVDAGPGYCSPGSCFTQYTCPANSEGMIPPGSNCAGPCMEGRCYVPYGCFQCTPTSSATAGTSGSTGSAGTSGTTGASSSAAAGTSGSSASSGSSKGSGGGCSGAGPVSMAGPWLLALLVPAVIRRRRR